jgi:hypothetical protein
MKEPNFRNPQISSWSEEQTNFFHNSGPFTTTNNYKTTPVNNSWYDGANQDHLNNNQKER